MPHCRIIFLFVCALVLQPAAAHAKTLNISLVLSESSPPYQQFAAALKSSLAAGKADINIDDSQVVSGTDADLIIAVGLKATELAASQSGIPVLAVMIPKSGYQEVLAKSPTKDSTRTISAIYLDQPWGRRIDFWRAVLPDRPRIGLLHSPDTNLDVAALRQVVAQQGGTLVAQTAQSPDELFSTLESVLSNSDVLLAIPDSMIYSSSSIRNILLTSYRYGIPIIGLSQAYVNAGALCAIFSTPEQQAVQASATVISFARTGQLPVPQYPDTYTIAVNQQVARSLGVTLPSQESIRWKMDKTGERDR